MAKALDVATLLTFLAQSGDEPDPLTHLRLQKLLYYCQGWSLGLRGKPLFNERIEAWAHGPVVPEVYETLCPFKADPFTVESKDGDDKIDFALDDDEREFIGDVWDSYQSYSALKLREMTHKEDPWVNARKGYGPADRCNVEITKEALKEYFENLAKE